MTAFTEKGRMETCRNCGSTEVRDLGFIGEVAPFFLKRVFNMEIRSRPSVHRVKKLIQAATELPAKALSRIHHPCAMVAMQACATCSFVQTKHGFSDESLGKLYSDYRSDFYNKERIRYEPTYQSIAREIGSSRKEIETRVETLTSWLHNKLEVGDSFSMLDYGGADGKFLPRLPGKRFVYEISDVQPVDGIVSIRSASDLGAYNYIQLAHILEHVSWPLELVQRVSQLALQNGYIYIEVPQDASDRKVEQLVGGTYRGAIGVHEHVNLYTTRSVGKLVESAGLSLLKVEAYVIDFGWTKANNIRALAKKV